MIDEQREDSLGNSLGDLDDLFADDGQEALHDLAGSAQDQSKWKIMIVDDEPGIHEATILSLMDVVFENKGLDFLRAYSGKEAMAMIEQHQDTSLILLDVVMEKDNAGLDVVKFIREGLKNNLVRIILRTGQPGQAPEEEVIMSYDINDYKAKSELTKQKLLTSVVASLRDYKNLVIIDGARRGLEHIIGSSASLFEIQSMENFEKSVITELTSLLRLDKNTHYGVDSSFMVEIRPDDIIIVHGTGPYAGQEGRPVSEVVGNDVLALLLQARKEEQSVFSTHSCIAYFKNAVYPSNMVYLESAKPLNDMDKRLVDIFCNNVSMAFENIEKHKMQESLKLANTIQMSMLPKNFSLLVPYGMDIYAFLQPAKEVGGDLYDFFLLDGNTLCVTVGDVSGKGVPAALFMAVTKTLIRSNAGTGIAPNEILKAVNVELCRDNDSSMFVTLFLAVIDMRTGVVTYSSAGHNPPFIIHASGQVTKVEQTAALPLGAMEDVQFKTHTMTIEADDALVIYSDGVTEAMNNDLELFGEERLTGLLATVATKEAKTVAEAIVQAIDVFAEGALQSDDITLMGVKFGRPGQRPAK